MLLLFSNKNSFLHYIKTEQNFGVLSVLWDLYSDIIKPQKGNHINCKKKARNIMHNHHEHHHYGCGCDGSGGGSWGESDSTILAWILLVLGIVIILFSIGG